MIRNYMHWFKVLRNGRIICWEKKPLFTQIINLCNIYNHSHKLQQARHFRWMGFLQQFHLVIRYKKGIFNKVIDMISMPIVSASIILKQSPIMHESYVEQYALDADFKEVYETLCQSNHVEELDYHLHNNLLYHLGKLCIP
jgi:hypothetical protein